MGPNPTQDEANRLFSSSAVVLVRMLPAASAFGIDLAAWTTGELFQGAKFIPPGLHFVHYTPSKGKEHAQDEPVPAGAATRRGFWHFFTQGEVLFRQLTHFDRVHDVPSIDRIGHGECRSS